MKTSRQTRFLSLLGISTILFSASSCETQVSKQPREIIDAHTSQNALDYDGIYRGTLPCDGCDGIKKTIYLMKDDSFKIISNKFGTSDYIEEKGKLKWNSKGNIISLTTKEGNLSFEVGENTLTMLDKNGNKYTSTEASKYMLTKGNYAILNKKWRLTELNGKAITPTQTNNIEAYIQFYDKENRFSANAGCNQMNGEFIINGYNRLQLSKTMMTMKACTDMSVESQLNEILQKADSFSIDNNELSLLKGKMAPMAKFTTAVH